MVDFVAHTTEGDTISDEQFFKCLAAELERRKPERRKMSGAQIAFTYATCWLLGAGVLIALVCGIMALVKLLFALTS